MHFFISISCSQTITPSLFFAMSSLIISNVAPLVVPVLIVVVCIILFSKYMPSLFKNIGGAAGNAVKGAVSAQANFARGLNSSVFGHAVDNPNKGERVLLKTGLAGGALVSVIHKFKGLHIGKHHHK